MVSRPFVLFRRAGSFPAGRTGFTLVELLVVVTIIAILIALLLPAVQSARESARCAQCSSNLKQLSLGVLQHIDKYNQYPTGGWGWHWVGDPDRGMGRRQTGGWLYNTLPYVEQEALYMLPADGEPDVLTPEQLAGANEMIHTPLKIANCPTRRRTVLFPKPIYGASCQGKTLLWTAYNAADNDPADNTAARTDYAMNAGGQQCNEVIPGPATLVMGDVTWQPCNEVNPAWAGDVCTIHGSCLGTCWPAMIEHDGLSYQRSEIRPAHIRDGDMCTIMLGEKYIPPERYFTGDFGADNESMFTGYNNDVYRRTAMVPQFDRVGAALWERFGAAHLSGCHFAFCDGRVRKIRFNIDLATFRALGNRNDRDNNPSEAAVDMMQFE